MIMEMHFLEVGGKAIKLTRQTDGSWIATCSCNALNCFVHFPLTAEEVRLLLMPESHRLLIQDILPNTVPMFREIFITGTTPAEFDLSIRGKLKSHRVYRKFGYELLADWRTPQLGRRKSRHPIPGKAAPSTEEARARPIHPACHPNTLRTQFEGFNFRSQSAIDHLVSAEAVVNWDHDGQGEAEFWPAGDVPEVALIFNHRSCVTATDLLDLDRVLVELGGDSRYNFLRIYSERRMIPSGTWECG